MSSRISSTTLRVGLLVGLLSSIAFPASAKQNVMKVCGAEWQKVKAKNNGEAPKGATWKNFLIDCSKRVDATTTKATPTKSEVAKKVKQAASPQSVMKVCGAEWQNVKAKNNGEAPKGVTWKNFLSDCRKRQPAARVMEKATTSKQKKIAVKSKGSGESMMSTCGDEWRKLKEKNDVPKGMTWTKYLSVCSKRYAGKFKPTPNQLAMYSRIRKCGNMWREAKEKGRLKKGITWPKYWSDCNARLTRSKR